MAMMNRASVALVLLVGSFLCGASLTRGAVYRVGDDEGWRVGVNYTKWASEKYIVVGDTLVFNYDPSKISRLAIVQVDWMAYDRCDLMEALGTYRSGNDSVQLTTPGHVYFMTLNTTHCHDGAKLHVFVHNATSADIPTPAKTGPTPSPNPPSTGSGPTPIPAPSSYGSSPSPAPASTRSGPIPCPSPPSTGTGPIPSPAPTSTGSSPSEAPTSDGSSQSPTLAPTSDGPCQSPGQAPASSESGPSPSPSPSPASTTSGPITPPPTPTVSVPSPSPDESPADDSAPAKSGGVILRCSEVVGLVLALAVAVMC